MVAGQRIRTAPDRWSSETNAITMVGRWMLPPEPVCESMGMEATTRIELVYTVLQTVA
jgi:hypothetical protein